MPLAPTSPDQPVQQDCAATIELRDNYPYTASIIVISFNTRDLLRECLDSLLAECARLPQGITAEIFVVDNASGDGSADMVERQFSQTEPPIRLIRSAVNLGFGAANNVALLQAQGRHLVLLNSDAFFHPGALACALAHMEQDLSAGIGGAQLVGRDGKLQFSGRMHHSILRDGFVLTGLSTFFPRSRFFAALDRTWADLAQPAEVDWVVGAFMILRREALAKTGVFDSRFFLYYEEVDLCRRVQSAGYRIQYWPDIVVTHLGNESSRTVPLTFSKAGAVVAEWRMRSTLLYYRKHHGFQARLALWLEEGLYIVRWLRNCLSSNSERRERAREARLLLKLIRQAWRDTQGGRISPPRPW